jgi:hypothetical protein
MRTIKISKETAERWYNGSDEELKAIAVQTYPELRGKPKTWEELTTVNGFFVTTESGICSWLIADAKDEYKNTFATREQAEASIAMAQLSQLYSRCQDNEYVKKQFQELIKTAMPLIELGKKLSM